MKLIYIFLLHLSSPAFAAHPQCDFCQGRQIQLGPLEFSGFEQPPNTTNFFSSIIIDQSEHFVLKVTRGAFVPFYFLIISKEHHVRVADLSPAVMHDLQKFKDHVEQFYRNVLQTPFVVFEHGPSISGARGADCTIEGGGGCVDHLHLHILPFSGEIETSADLRLPTRFEPPQALSSLSELTNGQLKEKPYIFYQNPSGLMHLYGIVGPTPSQLLRLLIAEELRVDDEFNWREFSDKGDFWANAAQSVAGYVTWLTSGETTARGKIRQKQWNKRVSGIAETIWSGDCSQLLSSMEEFRREKGQGSVTDFQQWLHANSVGNF